MGEKSLILFLILIFAAAGLFIFFISSESSEFNFHKAEISSNGHIITEKIFFKPDKDYHTLFRNFQSPVYIQGQGRNYIIVTDVKCSSGTSYVRDNFGRCNLFDGQEDSYCLSYTENNEYGCSFGSTTGFKKDNEYWIESTYELHPENIFSIKGKDYIKFVIYSSGNHKSLNENNFIIPNNIIREKSYSSSEDVILYIHYTISSANKLSQDSFEFDNNSEVLWLLIFCLIPSIVLAFSWFVFGREKSFADVPPELSFYPNERKAWEIAAYFNPPFSVIDKNFFAAMIIDFYHRKIIDIKNEGKNVWIKVNEQDSKMDDIEKDFYYIIKNLNQRETSGALFWKKTLVKDGWINLKEALTAARYDNMSKFVSMTKSIKDHGKNYIDSKGSTFIIAVVVILFIFGQFFLGYFVNFSINFIYLVILYFAFFFTVAIVSHNTTLFIKFKESYYSEYQHWQAFKKYLDNSFSIKTSPYKGIVIWKNFLVYGTALGVSDKVIKELKYNGILDDRNYAIYTGVYLSSGSFVASTGSSGGGFGGAGGGGMGGGGGGGR